MKRENFWAREGAVWCTEFVRSQAWPFMLGDLSEPARAGGNRQTPGVHFALSKEYL